MNSRDNANLRKLEELLCGTEQQTKEEALEELASNGVKISEFCTKLDSIVRKGYQKQVRIAADAIAIKTKSTTSRLFGDLSSRTKAELLAIRDQVMNGVFGATLQNVAVTRYRNHQGEEITEEELRTWFEDISTSDTEE